jgi:adenylate kinase
VRGQALQATIIVAGVPGVGKTTVLQELEAVAKERKVPLKIVNFGNVMNELFKKRGVEIHRDHMRKADITLQARIQEQAARMISKTPGNSTLVVDTHMFVRTNDGIWPGTPRRVLEALDPSMIVLIEADPAEVARRRAADTTRYRDSQNLEDAKTDLQWSRNMASAIAVLAGVPIQILQNQSGKQRQSAEELLKIIEKRS